jgi:amidohydrolase
MKKGGYMTEYAIGIRRRLHMYPEIGFDLDRTLSLLRSELEKMRVPYTEKYGKSSMVATINDEKEYTIGIRADMDALPISERNCVPYKSRLDGAMHACGHDVHTAILLGTVKKLNEMRDKINCRVKFLFQAAEEYTNSGAKLMADDGVMDDIDCIVALHVDSSCDVDTIALSDGGQNANSFGFTVEFFGESSHAAHQHIAKDAIAMAVKAYNAMHIMVAKEVPFSERRILNIGQFEGGKTNNVVCDYCKLFGTIRTWDKEVNDFIFKRICDIADAVARESGGRAEVQVKKFLPYVYNDPVITEKIKKAAVKVLGENKVFPKNRSMGGEDFSFFAMKKPGAMFRLGSRNKEKGIVSSIHQDTFDVDEGCIEVGINIFCQFVLDSMNG